MHAGTFQQRRRTQSLQSVGRQPEGFSERWIAGVEVTGGGPDGDALPEMGKSP